MMNEQKYSFFSLKSRNGVDLVKMPPRLSARRFCLVVAILAGLSLLVSLHYRIPWPTNKFTTLHESIAEQSLTTSRADLSEHQNEEKNVNNEIDDTSPKPWFFTDGTVYPTKNEKSKPMLFPEQTDEDRILEQLMYVPEYYEGYDSPEKVILVYNGLGTWGQKPATMSFHGCPVSRCSLTDDRSKAPEVDAILFKDHFIHPGITKPRHQVWMMYFLECPYHTQRVSYANVINWTATYRRDSDLVAPYERWAYYDPTVRQKPQQRNYAANKTKKVAWFVSNCNARNKRLTYARELSKYISVDIYGSCGPLKCPRTDPKCFEILERDYKFYLAFENSNCRDYITEKFYINGLGHNVLPIVMGARPEDYQMSGPEGSFIHVDEFESPKELAEYLHKLDQDDELYNSYFKWKGTGELINTYFWCRLCALLHSPRTHKYYENFNEWWGGSGVCTNNGWRDSERR